MSQTLTSEGSIVSIWRYPLKSMMGEELNSSYITERGLLGDRTYALIDQETGNVVSAKNPRKWGTLRSDKIPFSISYPGMPVLQ